MSRWLPFKCAQTSHQNQNSACLCVNAITWSSYVAYCLISQHMVSHMCGGTGNKIATEQRNDYFGYWNNVLAWTAFALIIEAPFTLSVCLMGKKRWVLGRVSLKKSYLADNIFVINQHCLSRHASCYVLSVFDKGFQLGSSGLAFQGFLLAPSLALLALSRFPRKLTLGLTQTLITRISQHVWSF